MITGLFTLYLVCFKKVITVGPFFLKNIFESVYKPLSAGSEKGNHLRKEYFQHLFSH